MSAYCRKQKKIASPNCSWKKRKFKCVDVGPKFMCMITFFQNVHFGSPRKLIIFSKKMHIHLFYRPQAFTFKREMEF